jgi:hypothetical protein
LIKVCLKPLDQNDCQQYFEQEKRDRAVTGFVEDALKARSKKDPEEYACSYSSGINNC